MILSSSANKPITINHGYWWTMSNQWRESNRRPQPEQPARPQFRRPLLHTGIWKNSRIYRIMCVCVFVMTIAKQHGFEARSENNKREKSAACVLLYRKPEESLWWVWYWCVRVFEQHLCKNCAIKGFSSFGLILWGFAWRGPLKVGIVAIRKSKIAESKNKCRETVFGNFNFLIFFRLNYYVGNKIFFYRSI